MEVNSEGCIRHKSVSDNTIEEFGTYAELLAFIAKYENLSFFFEKDEVKAFCKENKAFYLKNNTVLSVFKPDEFFFLNHLKKSVIVGILIPSSTSEICEKN